MSEDQKTPAAGDHAEIERLSAQVSLLERRILKAELRIVTSEYLGASALAHLMSILPPDEVELMRKRVKTIDLSINPGVSDLPPEVRPLYAPAVAAQMEFLTDLAASLAITYKAARAALFAS